MTDPNATLNDLLSALRARDEAIAAMRSADDAETIESERPAGISWTLASARADVQAHRASDAADALTAHLAAGGAMPDAWTPFSDPHIIETPIRCDSNPEATYRWHVNRLADRININADALDNGDDLGPEDLRRIAIDVRHLADSLPTPEADQRLLDQRADHLGELHEIIRDLHRQLAQASTNRAALQARTEDLAARCARALAEDTEPTTNPAP